MMAAEKSFDYVNHRNNQGETALFIACKAGHSLDLLTLFLDYGACLLIPNVRGLLPYEVYPNSDARASVRQFLLNETLGQAAAVGWESLVKRLCTQGAQNVIVQYVFDDTDAMACLKKTRQLYESLVTPTTTDTLVHSVSAQ
jgi:ankyrin repeat protein